MIGHCRSPRMNSMRDAELLIMRMQCAKYLDSKTSQWCRSTPIKLEKTQSTPKQRLWPCPQGGISGKAGLSSLSSLSPDWPVESSCCSEKPTDS